MNKEEAKRAFNLWLENNIYTDETLATEVAKLIDLIRPENKPLPIPRKLVELPQKVGMYVNNALNHPEGSVRNLIDINWDYAYADETYAFEMKSEENVFKLIDAYHYGWTPEPVKRFVLPMVKAKSSTLYAFKDRDADPDENWDAGWDTKNINSLGNYCLVTQSDIDSAPAWVKAIKPVPVEVEE
ncbi:MAG: hypothetical protein ABF743_11000 [Schleiferilactobacillus perolens]|uniref:hypothetical protein n=1 Tax=Schleiferilactobacillus perolens TaxID=100468 RepID=UPI0039EB03DD